MKTSRETWQTPTEIGGYTFFFFFFAKNVGYLHLAPSGWMADRDVSRAKYYKNG